MCALAGTLPARILFYSESILEHFKKITTLTGAPAALKPLEKIGTGLRLPTIGITMLKGRHTKT